jgi:serine O-acetyltransferase
MRRWAKIIDDVECSSAFAVLGKFVKYAVFFPELRNLFYYRFRPARFFSWLAPPLPTLYIKTKNIGPGLFIQHGFATIIAAKSIGCNCWINQQVTIGYNTQRDAPLIGDDVTITAGSKIRGGITIGHRVIVGANAVVVKNVPDDCTVAGVPAKIIRRIGVRLDEAL